MPDILLIQPPIRDFYLTAKRTLPYGLASIAATLRRDGFSVDILDALATAKSKIIPWPADMDYLAPFFGRYDQSPFALFHHFRHYGYSIAHIVQQALKSGAFLIGISSLFTAYSQAALETAAALKKALPRVPIVMGGHHATALPDAVISHPAVDYVLRGDGEQSLPMLAAALRDNTPLGQVPGLAYRKTDGRLVVLPPDFVHDLNTLPIPAFDLIKWTYYRRSNRGSLALAATRGCPLRCSYCAVNAAGRHPLRHRSVCSVMAELEAAHEQAPLGFIDFEDEHLGVDGKWFSGLLEAIVKRWGPRTMELRAMNGLFAPCLDNDILMKMQRAGFNVLNLALITTNQTQLKRFKRPDISTYLKRTLHRARRHGLSAVAYLIVAGPEQDPFHSVADLLFLAAQPVLAGVSVFYPAPGSDDYQWCRRNGHLPADPGLMRATALPLEHRTDRTQAVTLLRLGRILNFAKSLVDHGHGLPRPAVLPHSKLDTSDRIILGNTLLAAFLHDGTIHGVEKDGRVYPHQVDQTVAMAFLEGLRKIRLCGVSNSD